MNATSITPVEQAEPCHEFKSAQLALAAIHQSLHVVWQEIQQGLYDLLVSDWVNDFGLALSGIVDHMVQLSHPRQLRYERLLYASFDYFSPSQMAWAEAVMEKYRMPIAAGDKVQDARDGRQGVVWFSDAQNYCWMICDDDSSYSAPADLLVVIGRIV